MEALKFLFRMMSILCFSIFTSAFACVLVDDEGTLINLNKPAQRIVSLAPDITEILFSIGAGNRIVGVISGSDYPAAAKNIKSVGVSNKVNLERIVALHPDLIVVWTEGFSKPLSAIKKFGIPVYVTHPKRLEDIPRTMRNLGCLTGLGKIANQAADDFTKQLADLRNAYATQNPVKVFYQIGSSSLTTVNKDSWINQVIELCGGKNVFADASFTTPAVSLESVITANPQVILTDTKEPDWQQHWRPWPEIAAVKNHRLFSIEPDLIDRAGPRLVEGARKVCMELKDLPIIVQNEPETPIVAEAKPIKPMEMKKPETKNESSWSIMDFVRKFL